ncbi:MAG: (d)CMP kinase, partial [Clostridia bacterium]|nr:(d)CMP kinase [Clostridia bacterium]
MKIIRGATTIVKDTVEEIKAAVSEMMQAVFAKNVLLKEQVCGFLFSLTTDIHTYHPAKAARECGYDFAPLFACTEPEIAGQLPLCIRVMVFTELPAGQAVQHVYLKGARALRTDISEIFNIALDGPAGSGKSTIAKALAKDYNILYLDTGAMYRACGLKALRLGIAPTDAEAVEKMLPNLDVKVEYVDGSQRTILDGEDVSLAIRENAVSMAASHISAHSSVRVKMVELQREIAARMSCVLDGRDIGTVILPDAQVKLFLVADDTVRAKRRYAELLEKGQKVTEEEVLADMRRRDKNDSGREVAPA